MRNDMTRVSYGKNGGLPAGSRITNKNLEERCSVHFPSDLLEMLAITLRGLHPCQELLLGRFMRTSA
jgi:hypothetical protein